jgi:AcrR family transcriptional regulator
MQVFGSKGYRQGSLSEVAELVGMTHAGVLHHFGSKDQLLSEVLAFRDQVDLEPLEGKTLPGGADLFPHLIRTAEVNTTRPGLVQAYSVFVGESLTDGHPASEWVTQRFSVLRGEIVAALREIVEQARREAGGDDSPPIDEDELNQVASAIIGVMDGLQTQWLLDPDSVDLAGATRFAIESMLASAVARLVPGAPRP